MGKPLIGNHRTLSNFSGVLHSQPFSAGGGQELKVGRHENQRHQTRQPQSLISSIGLPARTIADMPDEEVAELTLPFPSPIDSALPIFL